MKNNYSLDLGFNNDSVKIAFGWLGFVNFPLFLYLWDAQGHEASGTFPRILSLLACIPLMFSKSWPSKLQKFKEPYWNLVLVGTLPVFSTYMFFANKGSGLWSSNIICGFLLLIFVTSWRKFLIILCAGIPLGILFYLLSFKSLPPQINLMENGVLFNFIWCTVVCLLFSIKRDQLIDQKLRTAEALGGMIAHEARTPLASLGLCLDGMQEDSQSHVEIKTSTFDKAFFLLKKLNWIIDSLLLNIKSLDTSYGVQNVSVGQLVEEAVMNYPLTDPEKNLIHLQLDHAFVLQTQPELFQHLLSNLIKNALYAIKKKGSGDITIKTYQDEKGCNVLEFMDTGCGIPKKHLSHLFETFFTTKTNGVGLGLAFVKKVVTAAGGTISCSSIEGDFTRFRMRFGTN